jgi:hypothetical protein
MSQTLERIRKVASAGDQQEVGRAAKQAGECELHGYGPERSCDRGQCVRLQGVNPPRGNGPTQPQRPGLTAVNDEPTPPTPDLIRSGGYWPTTKTRGEWEALPLSRGTALFTRMPTTIIANESACCRIVRSISLSTIRRIGPIHPEIGSLNS